MRLWDHKTPIEWMYHDHPSTPEEMDNPRYRFMLDNEIVLFDDGRGVVFSFSTLDELRRRYGVEDDEPRAALRKIKRAMSRHVPGPAEVSETTTKNARSIVEHDREIMNLGNEVSDNSRLINSQSVSISNLDTGMTIMNSSVERISVEVDGQEEHFDITDSAIEDLSILASDNADGIEVNAGAIEEMATEMVSTTETAEGCAEAVEEMIPELVDNTQTGETLSVAFEELTNLVMELMDRVAELESGR